MVSEASATNYDAIHDYVVIGLMLLGWTYFDAKVFKSKIEAPLKHLFSQFTSSVELPPCLLFSHTYMNLLCMDTHHLHVITLKKQFGNN